ncbi:HxsD-like protein [Bariatricus sp. HCP28S3_E4]|uniref:HxsD-like protein n=1 Tax=unclassified Bariatricus TaxID=2677046 RepID=UPI003F8AF73C
MITLHLHSEIYSVENIEYTKKVYANFANINITSENNYWLVNFSDCKYDEKETIKAFENYLIGLENS